MMIDGVKVTSSGVGYLSPEEAAGYVAAARQHSLGATLTAVHVTAGLGDQVDVSYYAHNSPFKRIRRITGYLVGTTGRGEKDGSPR